MNISDFAALLPSVRLSERSVQRAGGETLLWAKDAHQHYLLIGFNPQLPPFSRDSFSGEVQDFSATQAVKWCLPSTGNARKLRALFPWTAPQTLGLRPSFGCGDRIGLANAAHIRAARACSLEGRVGLVLAQHSHEMAAAGRRPDETLDSATWAVFAEGWREPWGADADRLQTAEDARRMAAAGFTLFTLDVSRAVGSRAAASSEARDGFDPQDYARQTWDIEGASYRFSTEEARGAFGKYGRALRQVAELAREVAAACDGRPFEIEVSFGEATTPTSPLEHLFIALELQRRGVKNVVALALRFVGEFAPQLQQHAAIARRFGHKLSVRSEGEEFDFPLLGKGCSPLLHVKTAAEWWLAALHSLAQTDAPLFREIVAFSRELFRELWGAESATSGIADESLWEDPTARRMLDDGFFGALSGKDARGAWLFRPRVFRALLDGEDAHFACVEKQARRHFEALGWCDENSD